MNDLLRFAKDENADQTFAIIDEMLTRPQPLIDLANDYENAKLDDNTFCKKVVDFINNQIVNN